MAERLSQILVQRGDLTDEQAQAAESRQVMLGGALDTAMLELGLDPGRLRGALADAFETPLATDEDLAAADDPRALRAIPERWAQRHQLPPVRLSADGAVLTVLSPAPADLALLIRLGELLEVQLEPRIALEVQVEERISRLYGRPLPERFAVLAAGGTGKGRGGIEPFTFREAATQLEAAEGRDAIGRALLGFVMAHLGYGALLVVQSDQSLRGWMGFGPGSERLPAFQASIAEHSVVRTVIDNHSHVVTSDREDSLGRALGRQGARSVVLAPLRVKDRTVAVLHADTVGGIPDAFAADLMLLLHRVQRSLQDLVLRSKASWSQLPDTTPPAPQAEAGDDDTELSEPPIPESTPRPEAPIRTPSREPMPPVPSPSADLDVPIEDPIEAESSSSRPRRTESLPDEPFPGQDHDDWEPVAVDPGDFVQGYELVRPQILEEAGPIQVATAPASSRDLTELRPHPATPSPTLVLHRKEVPSSAVVEVPPLQELSPEFLQELEPEPEPLEELKADALEELNPEALPEFSPQEARDQAPEPAPTVELAPMDPSTAKTRNDVEWARDESAWLQATPRRAEPRRPSDGSVTPWEASDSHDWSDPQWPTVDRAEPSTSQPVLLTERKDTDDAVEAWIERLFDPTPSVRREASETLVQMGPGVLDALLDRFPGPLDVDPFQTSQIPPFERCGPLLSVVSSFGREAHALVSRRLEAPDPGTRFFATYFYSSAFVPEAIPRLIQRLHDEEPRICMMAARTLFGYRDHPDFALVLDHLHGRLTATSLAARRHAAYLVGLFRDVTALPVLVDILDRKERTMLDVVQDALAEITKQRLGTSGRKWRQWMEKNQSTSRVLWLIEGLSAKDSHLRKSASDELEAVTGRSFGFDPDGPKRRREDIKQRWLRWWHEEGSKTLA
jgi:hypothetical protein